MTRTCKRGHDLDEVGVAANGQCRTCRRACDAAWQRDRYDALTGYEYNRRLLQHRRQDALQRRAQRMED